MNSFILDCTKLLNCQVLWSESETIQHHTRPGYFYSFYKINNIFHSIHSEILCEPFKWDAQADDPFQLRMAPPRDKHKNFISTYNSLNGRLVSVGKAYLQGADGYCDPRVTFDQTNAYAILFPAAYVTNQSPILVNLIDYSIRPISWDVPGVLPGKNWQPFLRDGFLYAVQEMCPLRILQINPSTGSASVVCTREGFLNLVAAYDSYPVLRGGANAVVTADGLAGIGHVTTHIYKHWPYLWAFDDKTGLMITFAEPFAFFASHGYNICDPTCVFEDRDGIYIGLDLCETNRNRQQTKTSLLLLIPSTSLTLERSNEIPSMGLVDAFPMILKTTDPADGSVPHYKRYFCSELPHAVPVVESCSGIRASSSPPGHIVHGPYLDIQKPARYVAILTYYTVNDSGAQYSGVFEAACTLRAKGGSLEAATTAFLAQSDIAVSGGVVSEISIGFDTSDYVGQSLELRVFSAGGPTLCVIDIVLAKVSSLQESA